jgi:hypothetical protein
MSARSAGFSMRDFRKPPPPGEENFPYFYQGAYISGIFLLQNLVTFWGKKIKKIFFIKKHFFQNYFWKKYFFPILFFTAQFKLAELKLLFRTKKSKKYLFFKFFENLEKIFELFFLIKKKKGIFL